MKTLLIDIARDLADIAMCGDPQPHHELSSVSQDALTSIRGRTANLQARVSALLELVNGASPGVLADWTDAHRQLFGQWCRANYPNEASAGMIALGEAWMDGLRVGASVALVATEPLTGDATSGTTAVELAGVAAARASGSGEWRTCAGCHESEDGHPIGEYPYSETFGCDLGAGCHECGGLGAVWDNTDYAAMGEPETGAPTLRDASASPADLSDALGTTRNDDAAQAADAERYRFIKAKAEQCDTGWVRYWRLSTIDIPINQPRATLDEAIDAVRLKRQPQTGESPTCQSGEKRAPRADDRDS